MIVKGILIAATIIFVVELIRQKSLIAAGLMLVALALALALGGKP